MNGYFTSYFKPFLQILSMIKRKAIFLDAGYVIRDGKTYAKLLVKGKKTTYLIYQYDPYFYIDAVDKKNEISKFAVSKNNEIICPKSVEIVEKNCSGEKKKLLKIYCYKPTHVKILRNVIPFRCYEHGIHYAKRFMLDFNLTPFVILEYEREGKEIKKFLRIEENEKLESKINLKKIAFDIETYNPLGVPRPRKDPVIMISYASDDSKGVFTYKHIEKEFVHLCKDELEMLDNFTKKIIETNPDIIYGYNTSVFDFPYLRIRAQMLNTKLSIGKCKTEFVSVKKGIINGVKIPGRIHLDIYPTIKFFGFAGLIKARDFTLAKIYEEITGKKKKVIERLNIWEMWDKEMLGELAEYSIGDSEATLELGEIMFPLLVELSKLTRMPLFDASLATSGQLVESLLMQESQLRNEIIPSKPSGAEVIERQKNPIIGAFVKLPEPGIYEKIAVFDFRGLYPSIIISYNIDPSQLLTNKKNRGNTEFGNDSKEIYPGPNLLFGSAYIDDVFVSPTNAKFIKQPKGLIPSVLERLLNLRTEIKKQLKKFSEESNEYKKLNARNYALKILTNSFYGYLGYARSRWYNRACAESVTAWGRKHIHETIEKAEKMGFCVLYSDTDSLFLLLNEKKKQDAIAFLEEVNKELPEKMELELENFYLRGVFVTKKNKKETEKGAKKKYALLSEDGKIKIRGFELVRRDWSKIAKDVQYKVLEAILREGSKEKAVAIVRETIEKLKTGKVLMDDLIIYTKLTKNPGDYDIISPELAAARKSQARGIPLEKGSVVSYIITKKGRSISDKAEIPSYAKDYDPDYYINNQVLPAVLKILKELGYSEDELKNKGKQKSLEQFF